MKTLLKEGMVYTSDGFRKMNVAIEGSKVFALSENPINDIFDKVIQCDNFFIVPGFIDVHVHLRQPGFEYKETIETGTAAAAKGGYTTICSMPNLNPAPVDKVSLQKQLDIIKKDGKIKVLPYGAITSNQSGRGKLSKMDEMASNVVAFSDDGKGVQDEQIMIEAMNKAKSLDKLIVAHCEDESYPTEDPASEWKQVARDISLVLQTGCPYHICHVSTKETVQLVRSAKGAGLNVSCETAPHYLVFSHDEIENEGRFKMNPPIREKEDRAELISGLKDGTIEIIATDHAPHSFEEKKGDFSESLFGIVGLETAFSVLYTNLVKKKVISFEKLIEVMSVNPAKRFSLDTGYIKEGCIADLAIVDTEREYEIDSSTFISKGHSTPFDGMKVRGEIITTIVDGKIVYEKKE